MGCRLCACECVFAEYRAEKFNVSRICRNDYCIQGLVLNQTRDDMKHFRVVHGGPKDNKATRIFCILLDHSGIPLFVGICATSICTYQRPPILWACGVEWVRVPSCRTVLIHDMLQKS